VSEWQKMQLLTVTTRLLTAAEVCLPR